MKETLHLRMLKDIRFWIFLFFLIRLFGITDPPLEVMHSWRQALTNMIARNFLEISPNIFFPRIDMAGEYTGIIGSEFPVFSYLIFLFSKLFGYQHWYGRLISLVVSSIGIYYFYLTIHKFFSKQVAFNSTIILTVSLWFSFSRKIMPDVFSVSLVIIGIYYCLKYLEEGHLFHLILFFLLSVLGTLSKIPSLMLLGVLAIPLLASYPAKRKIIVMTGGFLIFGLTSFWYFYWVPYLVESYHFQLYFPKGLMEGWNEIKAFPHETLDKFLFTNFYSYVAFAVFLAGLVLIFVKKEKLLLLIFSIWTAIFIVFMLKTGRVFSHHNYYIIPYTPLMALVAGFGLSFIKVRWQYLVLIIISIESLANQSHDFIIKDNELYKLTLEDTVEGIIGKEELIIVNGGQDPKTIYFLHRKGWSVSNEKLLDQGFIEDKIEKGARFLVIDNFQLQHQFNYRKIFKNEYITVYEL
jgi:4-amino-4-deoxy-L-arabinose transferase-like glycosyltransferase